MPSLQRQLAPAALALLKRSGEPLSLVTLVCRHHQWIQIEDQVLYASVQANLLLEAGDVPAATTLLRGVAQQAHEAYQTYRAEHAPEQDKRAQREARRQRRVTGPLLPEREVVRKGARRLAKPAGPMYSGSSTSGIRFEDAVRFSYEALIGQSAQGFGTEAAAFGMDTPGRLWLEAGGRTGVMGVSDWITRMGSPSARDVSSLGIRLSEQTSALTAPPVYEQEPDVVTTHPFWQARHDLEARCREIPLRFWQSTPVEAHLRGRGGEGPEITAAHRKVTNERKVMERALKTLIREGQVAAEGDRKNKRYRVVQTIPGTQPTGT